MKLSLNYLSLELDSYDASDIRLSNSGMVALNIEPECISFLEDIDSSRKFRIKFNPYTGVNYIDQDDMFLDLESLNKQTSLAILSRKQYWMTLNYISHNKIKL